uniref:Major facilitator superfamily (MFS) profile domain-containing protein n=1 Tax=Bionectria ochroleuca TaxID=29856 RepID=A0A8H7NHC2_BIOOC
MLEHEYAVAVEQRQEQWWSIFRGTNGLRTTIAFWPGLAQQCIGLKLFRTFGTYFFQQAGVSQPFTVKCITLSIQIATVLVNIVLVDNFGRRPLACWAVTISWVACCVVGVLGVTPDNQAKTYVFVLFACFWNIGMMTCGTVATTFNGEISSQLLRPYTAAFAVGITCVLGVIMDVFVLYMVNANQWNWGLKISWFYAGIGFPAMVGMWLLIPESKGRSTAELDELFERKIKPWRFSQAETATERLVKSKE